MREKPYAFYYGWIIVAVSFITLFLVLGTRCSFGLFYAAILREYGWSRAETAGAFSLMMIIHAMMAPVTGILIDRLGPRKLFPLGIVLLGASLMVSSLISRMWHLYLFLGVFSAIGYSTISFAPHMSRIPRWFIRKRGLASGLALSGIGFGTLFLALFAGFMIDTRGWRQAFFIIGAIIVIVLVPLNALFQRRSPEDVGQGIELIEPVTSHTWDTGPKYGRDMSTRKRNQQSWSVRTALPTLSFWCLNGIGLLQGFFIHTILVHLAVYILDQGLSSMIAASSIGVVGILGSLGGIIFGMGSDRIGREISYSFAGGAAVLGMVLLLFVQGNPSIMLISAFVLFYGTGYGAIISITAAATGDLFPGNALGRIISFQGMTYGIGAALGAYTGGFLYDRTGSYSISFLLVITAIIASSIVLWFAAPRKRQVI